MRKLLLLAALSATGYGIWHWQSSGSEPAKGKELVRDRLWIDHLPRSERESVQTFIILKDNPAGVFNNASMWRGQYEMFRYEMSGGQVRMEFPQTGDRDTVSVKATRCKEGKMDFCLELDGASRGAKRYYSREGWEIRSLDEARTKVDALVHE
jgi:hypothetical protein